MTLRFSFRRRLPLSSLLAFGAAGVCAIAAFLIVQGMAARAASAAGDGPTVRVVVAARDVVAGVALGVDDVTSADVPGAEPPPGAETEPTEVLGRVAVTPFLAGEPITTTRLAARGGPLSTQVPPGSVAVTIGVTSAPDGLRPGDRVDVLATYTSARPYTATVAEDLPLLRLREDAGSFDGGGGVRLTFTTSTETARTLVGAEATGVLAVVVHGYEPVTTPSPSA